MGSNDFNVDLYLIITHDLSQNKSPQTKETCWMFSSDMSFSFWRLALPIVQVYPNDS